MKLKIKELNFSAGRPISVLNKTTATRISAHVGERVVISKFADTIVSIIDITEDYIKNDEIAVSKEILEVLNVNEGDDVEISIAEKPESTHFIKKKMDGIALKKEEIERIIRDIVANALTEAEVAYFVAAVYKSGMSERETEDLIWAMVASGKRISFSGDVVDKHSIGGIAANRTTPIIIPICASLGLVLPKTSSRAITSAAGTADTIEAIAKVEFSVEEIKEIVNKTGACMVWGGSLGLSPADDKLIQIEKVINIDPEPQLLASVLSKKIAVGSKDVIIDIPFGKSAKVPKEAALKLKFKFEKLGRKFGLNIKGVLTNGEQPIGNGIGPILELIDVVKVLKRDKARPLDLENKALYLSGEILELSGKAKKGEGKKLAMQVLDSGKAFLKFKEIIEAQKGKVPSIKELEARLEKQRKDIVAEKSGKIKLIDNKGMNLLGRIAGSPMDKGAGVYLYKHLGDKVKKGDKIITIYSSSDTRLRNAVDVYFKNKPIEY